MGAHCCVVEAEIVGLMAGLGVFDLAAVGVEGLAGHDGEAVVVAKLDIRFIKGRCLLDGHAAFAQGDGTVQIVFDMVVNRVAGNLRGEVGDEGLQEIVFVKNQRFFVEIAQADDFPNFAAWGKASLC